jgi:hypothetical protein
MGEHQSLNDFVVAGRECGGCTACCKTLRIRELKKLAGVLCEHCAEGSGCKIYETRPSVCRGFYCGWKRLPYLGDEWRPDRCGILIGLVEGAGIPPGFPPAGLKFDVVESPRVLNWYPLIGLISKEIERGMPVFLGIPTPVGYERRMVFLNHLMADAVASRDRARIIAVLKTAYERALLEATKEKTVFD